MKNKAAVALGKLGAAAKAKTTTAEQRKSIAANAASARWDKCEHCKFRKAAILYGKKVCGNRRCEGFKK